MPEITESLIRARMDIDAAVWAANSQLKLANGQIFSFDDRPYLIEPMSMHHPAQMSMKATGGGFSECQGILPTLHGMIKSRYGQGVLYLFPTNDDVQDYSKSRFGPLFVNNKHVIGRYVKSGGARGTDTSKLKIVNGKNLYLRGARLDPGDEGSGAKTSTKLSGIQVDRVVFDEVDLIDPEAIPLALGRCGNASVDGVKGNKEVVYIANPSDEDRGIDLYWQKCLIPETKILTADLRWKSAGELKDGDKVIGFDEEHLVGSKTRRYRTTEVTNYSRSKMPCIKISLEDGTTITVSSLHKFLKERSGNVVWVKAKRLKTGDRLLSIGVWKEEKTQESGWIAGAFDGEGSLVRPSVGKNRYRNPAQINFCQKTGEVLSRMERLLKERRFSFWKSIRSNNVCVLLLKGGLPEMLRLCGTFRPVRFLPKMSAIWEGTSVGNDAGNTRKLKVVNIEDVGDKEVVVLSTTHKTFIAEGLLSHNSDQRYWFRKCVCGEYTCAELEFQNDPHKCIGIADSGKGYIRCRKCEKPIGLAGEWRPQRPSNTELAGYHWSHLSSNYCDPADVLRDFTSPPDNNLGAVYRYQLGLPYSSKEDKLRKQDVLNCCGSDIMPEHHPGPCAMGVDVGKVWHVVIGIRTGNDRYEILRVAPVGNLNDIHDLAKRYGVKSAVIDIRPYEDSVRKFQKSEPYRIFLAEYTDSPLQDASWNDNTGVVKAFRTGIFDATHRIIMNGQIKLPRQCPAIEEFAQQCSNCVKSRDERRKDIIIYRYVPTGSQQEHYRNSLNYFILAASKVLKTSYSKGNTEKLKFCKCEELKL